MPRSLRTTSFWDSIPSETVLDICSFLSTIDLLNLCAAYHDIQQLALSTSTLWHSIHLPYPDPQLHNYPGWRRLPLTASTAQSFDFQHSTPASHQSERSRQPSSSIPVLQGARFRFMTAEYDSDLYSSDSSENSIAQPEFIAWIILDVLESIPLHFTRHLSFDSPPCHLCDYPCKRFCACECHQNEQTHRQQDTRYQSQRHLNTWHPPQQDQMAPLSQPLQNLFESGLVDFSRHIDVRSLNQALTTETAAMTVAIPLTGISHLSYVSQSDINTNNVQEELSLEDALQQLSSIEDEQAALETESQHTTSHPPYSETPVQTYGTFVSDVESIRNTQETDHQPSEEERLEESRQQYETRAAYLRARLLMQILSLRDLGSLETLRAPWWPATKIYTIRQQLERWSFMVEQDMVTNQSEEVTMGQELPSQPESTETLEQGTVPAPRTHWTNRLLSDIGTDTTLVTRTPSANSGSISEESAAERQSTLSEAISTTTAPSFPLASLTAFSLRCGGEVSSHERHCLGMSAMILSGRSSANSSQSATPPSQTTDHWMPIPSSDRAPPTSTALHWPCKRVFRYCHHCGSQYLQDTTTTTLRRACFCERLTILPS